MKQSDARAAKEDSSARPQPPMLPKGFRQESVANSNGQQRGSPSQGHSGSGPDPTPHTRRLQPYEFDSCISTEEAFFGIEESKHNGFTGQGMYHNHQASRLQKQFSGGYRQTDFGDRSNPQEDSTPKAALRGTQNTHHHFSNNVTKDRRTTAESIRRGFDTTSVNKKNSQGMGNFGTSRQRTQRLSPKGKSFLHKENSSNDQKINSGRSSNQSQMRGRNRSMKLLNDQYQTTQSKESPADSNKLKSELISPKSPGMAANQGVIGTRLRQKAPPKLHMVQR